MEARIHRETSPTEVAGERLFIDGFNLLTTVESALAGGVVLIGRDSCWRDMASMNGHFKRVTETVQALDLIGLTLVELGPSEVVWLLDRPVSNSGRLAKFMGQTALERGWNWRVELVPNPDPLLAVAEGIIVSADSGILEAGPRWVNLACRVVRKHVPGAWLVDFAREV